MIHVISIFVWEGVQISEACRTCPLTLVEGIMFGYYEEPENCDCTLSRAYDILFDETLKRLESNGIHLRL
jgi:hypothetical protein